MSKRNQMQKAPMDAAMDAAMLETLSTFSNQIKDAPAVITAMKLLDAQGPTEAQKIATLHSGIPGVLLFISEINTLFPDEQWDELAHIYVEELVAVLRAKRIFSISLFSGLSGMGLGVLSVSQKDYYPKLLGSITDLICDNISPYTEFDTKEGIMSQLFDVIDGMSGVVNFLLLIESQHARAHVALEQLLTKLVRVTLFSAQGKGSDLLAWYIPRKWQFTEQERKEFPSGNVNTGVSHGIAGVLLALTRAAEQGIIVDKQMQAIKALINTLNKVMLQDGQGYRWKPQVSYEEIMKNTMNNDSYFLRDAWCYGNPGISYAMYRAAKLIKDVSLCATMLQIFSESVTRPLGINAPTICHGYSGLYILTEKMEELSGAKLQPIKDQLWRTIEQKVCDASVEKQTIYKKMGLLDGQLGTMLTVIDAITQKQYIWKHAFSL